MSQGMSQALREVTLGRKEMKTTAFNATYPATEFTSQLTTGNFRKALIIYCGSGEAYVGDATLTPNTGLPIPIGIPLTVPVTTDLSVYFCSKSGEIIPLRAMEVA